MNIQECYQAIGGKAEDILYRLRTEERIVKYLTKFLEDGSFAALESALKAEQYEEAFRAAHSLKGICMNLGLGSLLEEVFALTENLRDGRPDDQTPILYERVRGEYRRTSSAVRQYIGDQ